MTNHQRANQIIRQAPGFPHVPERFLATDALFEEWLESRWSKPWKKYRDVVEDYLFAINRPAATIRCTDIVFVGPIEPSNIPWIDLPSH